MIKALLSRSYGSNLQSSFNIVLSNALVCSTHPPVSVWGTVYTLDYFLEHLVCNSNPIRKDKVWYSSLLAGPEILIWFPSTTAFALALGAAYPARLTWRRNPWMYGDSVSRTINRYSCQNSHFRTSILATTQLQRLTERSATTSKECPQFRCMV